MYIYTHTHTHTHKKNNKKTDIFNDDRLSLEELSVVVDHINN